MASNPSLKVYKTINYKGTVRNWSNRYYFDGTTPPDSTHWTTLSDAVVTAEKAAILSTSTIVLTQGFAAGSDVPVFSKTYATAGTHAAGGGFVQVAEAALLLRWATNSRTSKNHPLYLFNYYHGTLSVSATVGNTAEATHVTALTTYGTAWITGFSDGGVTHHRTGPNGDLATGVFVNPELTHRDFPN